MKRKRGEHVNLESIPSDVIKIIISFVPFEKNNWLSLRLVSKSFLALCKQVQDPSMRENDPIVLACKTGNVAMVKDLLQDPRVDPSARRGRPLCFAARRGHAEVVKELLKDPRVDPCQKYNFETLDKDHPDGEAGDAMESDPMTVLDCAFWSGEMGPVAVLLQDPRITPREPDFVKALCAGYWSLVSTILGHQNYKRSEKDREIAYDFCWHKNNAPLLREIFKIFPEMDTKKMFLYHISQKNTEIVRDLVQGKLGQKPIPLSVLEEGMKEAITLKRWKIVQILADALHANGSTQLQNFFLEVAEKGHYETFAKLRQIVGKVSIPFTDRGMTIMLMGENPAIMIQLIEDTHPDFSEQAVLFAIAACDTGKIALAKALIRDPRFVASDEQIAYINRAITESGSE